jgi:hypothetical protein
MVWKINAVRCKEATEQKCKKMFNRIAELSQHKMTKSHKKSLSTLVLKGFFQCSEEEI